MARYVDFRALKAAVPMTDILRWLNIETMKDGYALRAECPFCQRGGERALYITPSRHIFACHGTCPPEPGKKAYGGDSIKLVAAINGCSEGDAAVMIAEKFGFLEENGNGNSEQSTSSPSTVTVPSTKKDEPPSEGALQPLTSLTTDHPLIERMRLTPAVCDAIGIGYTSKGLMRSRVAFPLRLPDGTLVGYMGIATSGDQEPPILFPKNLEEKCAPATPAKEPKTRSADIIDIRKLYRG